jgi:arylsulfatase A-like enzyme
LPACGESTGPSPSKPNVIVLLVDTLRRDRLGVHGYDKRISPCMDRLAAEGVCFNNAVAPSSWTKPSVASLMTGLYASRHGAILYPSGTDHEKLPGTMALSQSQVTLSEKLKTAGFRTAAFITNPHIIPSLNFDQGFDTFVQPAGIGEELFQKSGEWIETLAPGERFYLYLHLFDPHIPYFPPKEYRKRFAKDGPGERAPYTRKGSPLGIQTWLNQYKAWKRKGESDQFKFDYDRFHALITEKAPDLAARIDAGRIEAEIFLDFNGKDDPALIERTSHLISLYDGEVAYTDDAMERFIAWLKEKKLLENTILIVTADHGEGFMEHDTWGHHYNVFGEEIDVPLLFRIPGPDGPYRGAFDAPVSLVDIFPTVLDILGMTVPREIDGISLWPAMKSSDPSILSDRPVFSELILNKQDHAAIFLEDWKLIRTQPPGRSVKWLLYDLKKDPNEQAPLDIEGVGDSGAKMKRILNEFLQNRTLPLTEEGAKDFLSEEEIKQMKALGYM